MIANNLPPPLHYTNDTRPGYYRKTVGEKIIYLNSDGAEVKSEKILNRINNLTIPPQWKKVWISKDKQGHLQAVGRDAKGRKQYIYHPLWKKYIEKYKYRYLLIFAKKLPKIRSHVEKDLRKRKWTREKVVALAIRLMDELLMRVGNVKYQKENGTYGLTTLRKKHLQESVKGLTIKYKAKSEKYRKLNVEHPILRKLLKQCSELPGYEVFRYASDGKYIPINSQDINLYLKNLTQEGITAKSFRTWGGTVLTLKLLPKAIDICSENPRKKLETTLVRLVANELNNTVSVCRKYYIHPEVLKFATESRSTEIQKKLKKKKDRKWLSAEEKMVIEILEMTE